MKKYIDADYLLALQYVVNDWYNGEDREILDADDVRNAPAADVVEAVRCSECWKRGDDENCPMCNHCHIDETPTKPDDFCSYGERWNT